MPQRITIEHFNPNVGEYWVNRYFTTDAVDAAGDTLDALVAAHVAVHLASVLITKARIDDNVEGTDNFDTVSYNTAGTRSLGSDVQVMLPLFNVARVDFDVSGGGRPSRKYLRGTLIEGEVGFTGLASGLVAALNTYADAVVAIGTICDPQGNLFVDGVVWPYVQMRQLRRGSKKKSTP